MKANHSRDPILVVIAVVLAMVATMATTSVAAENAEVDATAPQTTITFPTRNIVVEAGNSLEVLGHASDDTAVRKVDVAIRDRVNKTWWWGADQGFETGWPRPHAITGQPVGGGWPTNFDWEAHGDLVFLPPGSYAAYARAFDTSGNYDLTPAWVPFRVAAPMLDLVVDHPTQGSTVGLGTDDASLGVRGTVTGNNIDRVAVAIVDRATRQWVQPLDNSCCPTFSSFGPRFTLNDTTLRPWDPNADRNGVYKTDFSLSIQDFPVGSYGMSVRAYDGNGKVTRTWIRFTTEPSFHFEDVGVYQEPPRVPVQVQGFVYVSYWPPRRVRLAIRDQATRSWLQPDGTFAPTFRLHNANVQGDGEYFTWEPDTPLPPGEYGMTVLAIDAKGNVQPRQTRPWIKFTVA